jgi:hypothetical protein
MRVSDVLCGILGNLAPSIKHAAYDDALARMGRDLQSLAALRRSEFIDLHENTLLRSRSAHLIGAQQALSGTRLPTAWAKTIERQRAEVVTCLRKKDWFLPDEFRGNDRPLEECQAFICAFGELLEWWPRLWRVAVALHAEGVRASEPL